MGVWGHREPRRGVGVPRELWDPGRPWQGVEVPDGVWGPWQGVWGRGGGSHGELGSLGNPWGMRAHPRMGMGALRGAPGRCGAVWGPGGVWGCAGLFRGPPWGRGSLWGGAGGAGGGVGVGWLPGGSGPRPAPHPSRLCCVSQNKLVERCERLQLQSAAIARHVDEVLPAKDQGVLVSPWGWPRLLPARHSRQGCSAPGGGSSGCGSGNRVPGCACNSCFICLKNVHRQWCECTAIKHPTGISALEFLGLFVPCCH